jgi:hypothetical protein
MMIRSCWFRSRLAVVMVGAGVALVVARRADGFTQHAGTSLGNPAPMGHEWITRLAAIELLGGDRVIADDPKDVRKTWKADGRGMAKNTKVDAALKEVARIKASPTSENVYAATYKLVWDAIIGERWVDIGGHNYAKSRFLDDVNCLDMVTQEPMDIQYDHYMRKYDEIGGEGGITAAKASKEAFIRYFVAAAKAPSGEMPVWDGGGYATAVTVDRNYFLFGRALHLLEDSFSPDHTVRVDTDRFEKVRQVKSYLCAPGSEQHLHPSGPPPYENGDVIWKPESKWAGTDFSTYRPSNMKDVALVATEATKDAWAAFIRTMAVEPGARATIANQEAARLANDWLSLSSEDEARSWYRDGAHRDRTYVRSTSSAEDGGNGRTVAACMQEDLGTKRTQAEQVKMIESARRTCLYNMVPVPEYADNLDPSLHAAYDWEWRSRGLETPPKDWEITKPPPFSARVQIVSRQTRQPMGFGDSDWIYCDGQKDRVPIDFDMVGPLDNVLFRVASRSGSFLNQSDGAWGQVGLYSSTSKGSYKIVRRPDGSYNIFNNHWKLYMYIDDYKPFVHKNADPNKLSGQWLINGLPQPYLPDGTYRIVTATEKIVTAGANPTKASTLAVETPDAVRGDARSQFHFTRQGNGTYTISPAVRPNLYVQSVSSEGKSTLTFGGTGSPVPARITFHLEEQRGTDSYRIRAATSGHVWKEMPGSGIGAEAQSFFIPPAGCEYVGDVGTPAVPEGNPKMPPPGMSGRCNDPSLFVLQRVDWP